ADLSLAVLHPGRVPGGRRARGEHDRRRSARRVRPELDARRPPRRPAGAPRGTQGGTQRGDRMSETPLLRVDNLEVSFPSEAGRVRAVRGVSWQLEAGEVLGIVGESGSGKSVSSLAIMGLLPERARVSGSIRLRDRELIGLSDKEFSAI